MVVVDPEVQVESQRLLLRPLRLLDAVDVNVMHSHPEVMLHTSLPPADDIKRATTWIQGCHNATGNWNFAVELLPSAGIKAPDDARVIGMVGAVRAPEIGYMFNAKYWGKGYATEALRAFLPLFFRHYSGDTGPYFEWAEAHVDPELVSSQKVLQKVGFEFVEERKRDFENLTLGWRDTWIYRVSRERVLENRYLHLSL